ncbi:hypothetical protein [Streptomyces zhihengii]|uniref:hypothetical protein n=1 Tax=Streptomyces zhihengii TaxID=1818004 RepID=UPI0033A02ABF
MCRHTELTDGCRTLVTTGTGNALTSHRLVADLMTSVDVAPTSPPSASTPRRRLRTHPRGATR